MSSLTLFAGPTAYQRLRAEGLQSQQFDTLVGASGGPKWFVLHGLDRFLFGDFLQSIPHPLRTLGSSAGAWRLCCLATADPVAAIDRLAQLYSTERYSAEPSVEEITSKAAIMVAATLGESGPEEIVGNSRIITHVVADRARGPGSSHLKWLQGLNLAAAMAANALSRATLSGFLERTIFTNSTQPLPHYWHDLKTVRAPLRKDNVLDVMLASGSIPFVLAGVRNPAGAKPGLYWDGGITDYHFDMPFNDGDKLVLYPHFSPTVIPGWFDKRLRWRSINEKNFDNVLMITPSREFTEALPYGKIPDREDFNRFDYDQRQRYWQTALSESRRLADDFAELLATQRIEPVLRPFSERLRA